MKKGHQMGYIPRLLICLLMLYGLCSPSAFAAETEEGLLQDVVHLNLGLKGYSIGKSLTAEQKKFALAHPGGKAYAGTYKFVDQDLFVVVEEKSDSVLALYKRITGADNVQLKNMVAALMDRFGLPTAMAHNKIVYWAFNRHGAVSEDDFELAKKNKQIPGLGIIATVKLNSEMEIIEGEASEKKKDDGAQSAREKQPVTGIIYFIITSDPLVKAFLNG